MMIFVNSVEERKKVISYRSHCERTDLNLSDKNMAEPVQREIIGALRTAEGLYYRLVLLVGPSSSGKTDSLQALRTELQSDIISVNSELSKLLLDMTTKQRTLHVPKLLEQIAATAGKTVLLDNIEMLFDVELKQDPLRLLQGISRNRTIVAAWNGYVEGQKLLYAEPGHQEYRVYDAKDLLIVTTTDEHR